MPWTHLYQRHSIPERSRRRNRSLQTTQGHVRRGARQARGMSGEGHVLSPPHPAGMLAQHGVPTARLGAHRDWL